MRVHLVLSLVLIGACQPHETPCAGCGVQVGGEPGDTADDVCGREVVTEAPLDQVAIAGHDGPELRALVEATRTFAPVWWDDRTEALTLSGTLLDDTVQVVDYPDGHEACARRVTTRASLRLVSANGTIDEAWEAPVHWSRPWSTLALAGQIPVGALGGDLDAAALAPDAEELIVYLRLAAADAESLGYVELRTPERDTGARGDERERVCTWNWR